MAFKSSATIGIASVNDILPFARAIGRRAAGDLDGSDAPQPKPRTASPARAVIWVYRDYDDRWCVRREGSDEEASCVSRLRAVEFARTLGMAAGSYRIFLELRDGRVIEEHFGTRR